MCDTCNEKQKEINRLRGLVRSMNTLYCLFQTDVWKSKNSYVLFGIFSTKNAAIDAAKENNLYTNDAEVVIREITLDDFDVSGIY